MGAPDGGLRELAVMVEHKRFFVEQAVRCWRLSQGLDDQRLVELGREFTERALNLGADPDDLPEVWCIRQPRRNYHRKVLERGHSQNDADISTTRVGKS